MLQRKFLAKFDFIVEEVEKLGKNPESDCTDLTSNHLSHRDEVVNASRLCKCIAQRWQNVH